MNAFEIISPEPTYIASMVNRHIDLPGIVKVGHVRMDEFKTPTVEEILHITFHQETPTGLANEYPERVKGFTGRTSPKSSDEPNCGSSGRSTSGAGRTPQLLSEYRETLQQGVDEYLEQNKKEMGPDAE